MPLCVSRTRLVQIPQIEGADGPGFKLTDESVDAHKVVQAVVQLAGKESITANMLKLLPAGSRQKCI